MKHIVSIVIRGNGSLANPMSVHDSEQEATAEAQRIASELSNMPPEAHHILKTLGVTGLGVTVACVRGSIIAPHM